MAFTIAVDSSFGATSGYGWNSSAKTVTFGTDTQNSMINVVGITGSSAAIGALGITFTTVSSSVITDLG